jgi:hypothetical protein
VNNTSAEDRESATPALDVASGPLVYLDQNQWITAARVANGRDSDPARITAHQIIRQLSAAGAAVFPLSVGHYLETQKRSDLPSRRRLGVVMSEISRGWTLAPYDRVVRHELEAVLAIELPGRIRVTDFRLIGKGVGFAFDRESEGQIRITEPLRGRVPPAVRDAYERRAQEEFEESVLTGWSSKLQDSPPTYDPRPFGEEFARGLRGFREKWQSVPPGDDLRNRLIRWASLTGVLDELNEVLASNRISPDELLSAGTEADVLNRLLDAMPTRRLDMHLQREVVRNPSWPIEGNDLIDWAQVGLAAMYCDVVVTERKMATLLNRPDSPKRAVVISDLRDLPGALTM